MSCSSHWHHYPKQSLELSTKSSLLLNYQWYPHDIPMISSWYPHDSHWYPKFSWVNVAEILPTIGLPHERWALQVLPTWAENWPTRIRQPNGVPMHWSTLVVLHAPPIGQSDRSPAQVRWCFLCLTGWCGTKTWFAPQKTINVVGLLRGPFLCRCSHLAVEIIIPNFHRDPKYGGHENRDGTMVIIDVLCCLCHCLPSCIRYVGISLLLLPNPQKDGKVKFNPEMVIHLTCLHMFIEYLCLFNTYLQLPRFCLCCFNPRSGWKQTPISVA